MRYIGIIIGGGIGALLRYISSQGINSLYKGNYRLGTLLVNCVGALLAGFLINLFDQFSLNIKWKLFVITGFLGGYTTFSAYSLETVQYLLNGSLKQALVNILLNNVLCLAFVLLGMWLNRILLAK